MGRRREKQRSTRHDSEPSTRASLPYQSRISLLTAGERRFYHEGLLDAVGARYLISFKVRLADVITVRDWKSKYGRKIAQKHLDFVLITPRATRIVAAIELNDASHEESERQQRDEFLFDALRCAGIPLITFPIYRSYDSQKIRRRILAAISSHRRK